MKQDNHAWFFSPKVKENNHAWHKSRFVSIRNMLALFSRWNSRYRVKIAKGFIFEVYSKSLKLIYTYINPDRDSHPPALRARSVRHWIETPLRVVVSLRYSSVLPTSHVFRSGYIKYKSVLYFLISGFVDVSFVVCCPISNHVMTPLGVLWLCFKFIYKCSSFLINNIKKLFSKVSSHDLTWNNKRRS